jgi:tRNA threonylcarbamoyladenosine biosynthesis protein TsaB
VLVLALDTSSLRTSCALADAGAGGDLRVLAEALYAPPARAGDVLPEALERVCTQAGSSLDAVEAVAVGLGPGSFTGLRVGIAAAKALAYARRWPLAGASSLHALALGAAHLAREGQQVIATTEARKGELYAAVWLRAPSSSSAAGAPAGAAAMLTPAQPAAVYPAERFAAFLREQRAPLVLGPGAAACAGELAALGIDLAALSPKEAPASPPAWAVAALCAPALSSAPFDAAALFAIGPDYLKPSEAEVALGEGRVGGLTPPGKMGQGGAP